MSHQVNIGKPWMPPDESLKSKADYRPAKGGWAHGWYLCRCCHCQETFIGDKRSVVCSDCAYGKPTAEFQGQPIE